MSDLSADDRAELDAFRAECDKVAVPHDPAMLVRHHRGNGSMIGVLAAKIAVARTTGSAHILAARWNQVLAGDDERFERCGGHDLITAANCYAAAATYAAQRHEPMPIWVAREYHGWPFDEADWAPSADPVECLATAGAHLAADIDRRLGELGPAAPPAQSAVEAPGP
jgi:hypothetical protein